MKRLLALSLAFGLGLVITACGDGGKGAADTAIKAAETAFAAVQAEAVRYVPDQVKTVADAIAATKDLFAKGNYTQALADAQALTGKITALGDAAAAKKAELTKNWEDMSAGLPGVVEAIKGRVDILSQAKKLPAGLTQEAFDGAKAGLDMMTQTWTEAGSAFTSGNVAEAVAKAQTVKAKAAEVMTSLGMEVPAALR